MAVGLKDGKNPGKIKSKEFDSIAREVFAPIYPLIARQIMGRCSIVDGVCVDLGSGPASLAIAVSKVTGLKVYAMDSSEDMLEMAKGNIEREGLSGRVIPVIGDVSNMPFADGFADMVISRGSFFFWEDLQAAFKEVYRILKPGGMTYIGGGFGNAGLKSDITLQMRKIDENWEKGVQKRWEKCNVDNFIKIFRDAKIDKFDIIDDETGFWILIRK